MLECDFSSLLSLNKIIFTTTPLSHSSFFTLPPNLKELRLIQMDTLDTATMVSFFEHGRRDHNLITRLAINRCPRLLDKITTWLPLHQLEWLFLSGRDIKDQHILAVLTMAGELDTLVLDNTQITTRVLDFMDSLGGGGGDDNSFVDQCRLHIKQLVMTNNNNIPPHKQQHTSRC
ncbi:hypothetical protein BC941DRAFT_419362 [Chlamydoabsidia padenii]|nr:hypothetical protein BC941DRAFT_419362 [Chlamydoabsidia padenii]